VPRHVIVRDVALILQRTSVSAHLLHIGSHLWIPRPAKGEGKGVFRVGSFGTGLLASLLQCKSVVGDVTSKYPRWLPSLHGPNWVSFLAITHWFKYNFNSLITSIGSKINTLLKSPISRIIDPKPISKYLDISARFILGQTVLYSSMSLKINIETAINVGYLDLKEFHKIGWVQYRLRMFYIPKHSK
jgi:hypothetical protein